MHKINWNTYCLIIILSLFFGKADGTILETLGVKAAITATAKIAAAVSAKLAALKAAVATVETMTIATTAATTIGTLILCDKVWNLSMAQLAPTHKQKMQAFNVQQWQFNEKAIAENKQLREQVEALKTKLKQSEEVAQKMLTEAQLRFAQYCEVHNFNPNDTNLPPDGKNLQIAVGLIYCCLRIIYP